MRLAVLFLNLYSVMGEDFVVCPCVTLIVDLSALKCLFHRNGCPGRIHIILHPLVCGNCLFIIGHVRSYVIFPDHL